MKHIPNISYTLTNDLCLGCGICENACPSKAITTVVIDGRFLPKINENSCKNSKGCHRCHDICPGVGIELNRIASEQFTDKGTNTDKWIGRYMKCFTGHSNDYNIRYHSASGGMVSQFLIFLLKKGYIDGALVTAFDQENELLVRSYIATTAEDILAAKSSKYAPVSLHSAAVDIKTAKGNKYVIVGLPCHIEGFRKLEAVDRKFKEKIAGYFAIYCSSGRTFNLTEYVFNKLNIQKEELIYLAYRDEGCLGSLVAKTRDGKKYKEKYQSYYHPLRSFFVPRRCLLCIDHYGELGDVCFGDIHIEPYMEDKIGVNSLVVRKQVWLDRLLEAKAEGYITLDEISAETLNSSQKMAKKKKGRNERFIILNRRLKHAVPKYDVAMPHKVGLKTVLDYAQNRTQQFLGRHKGLWWLINILKKDTSNYR